MPATPVPDPVPREEGCRPAEGYGLVAVYDKGIDGQHRFVVMEIGIRICGQRCAKMLGKRGQIAAAAVGHAETSTGAGAWQRAQAPGCASRHSSKRERADLDRRRRREDRGPRSGAGGAEAKITSTRVI